MLCLHLQTHKIDNEIDESAFRSLTESMVREIVLPIGPRSKIFKKIEELKISSNLVSLYSILL